MIALKLFGLFLIIFLVICLLLAHRASLIYPNGPSRRHLIRPKFIQHGDWPLVERNGKWFHRDTGEEMETISLTEFIKRHRAPQTKGEEG